MGRSMAEGVRIMRIMITLTDKGFLKEAAAEPHLSRLSWLFSFSLTPAAAEPATFSRSDWFQLDTFDTPGSSRRYEQEL